MIEIERKFLVKPGVLDLSHVSYRSIAQCYLGDTGTWAVRARCVTSRIGDGHYKHDYLMTLKKRLSAMSCVEIEEPVGPASFLASEQSCGHPPIRKLRYDMARWEIDVFRDDYDGLVLAEIELSSEDEAFDRPDWLGEEVTGNPRYNNAAMAERLRSSPT